MKTDKWQQIAESPEAAALLKLALHINDICDHEGDITDFLPTLLHQLAQLLDVQSTAITVIDSENKQKVLSRYDRGETEISSESLVELANVVVNSRELFTEADSRPGFDNVLAVPIIRTDRVLGSFILANKSNANFGDYDRIVVTLVESVTGIIDTFIFQEEKFKRLMKLVGREATRDVEEALMGHGAWPKNGNHHVLRRHSKLQRKNARHGSNHNRENAQRFFQLCNADHNRPQRHCR